MGSVKDLEILKKPEGDNLGLGRFTFSDDYSVLDFGKMPDSIKGKGVSLCMTGGYCFEQAEEQGINTHYRGLVNKDGEVVYTDELDEPTNVMEVNLVRVFPPEFRDGEYHYANRQTTNNLLIPLEIIYRNYLPKGSSVFRRLERRDISYQDLELDHYPEKGEKLSQPLFDVSTKLEETDRYITWEEAQKLASLNNAEVDEIKETLSKINNLITKIASKAGLVNEDGKIELAYDSNGRLMLIDVLGTLDECRFTYEGIPVSKEIAREYYRNTFWADDVETAKRVAKENGIEDWRKICRSEPPQLGVGLDRIVSNMYTSTANEFLGRKIFDAPKLGAVVGEYLEWYK
ncbi:MAG: phosphoribosylaminoimidazolesuccinocarboxamide synthase [Candidatus Aenigmatarchaeota archaeon]|nr:MAG: phosphoribosylaminoimidazolesuccinocarboxamide synthase [Candidatus Aenigmarchaeota archaeon]